MIVFVALFGVRCSSRVVWLLFVVRCLLRAVCCLLVAVCWLCLLFVFIGRCLFALCLCVVCLCVVCCVGVCCSMCGVRCLLLFACVPFVVCCSSFVVRRLLLSFVIC